MDEPAGHLPLILTAHLFPRIENLLIELLRSLRPEEWQLQTVSPRWKVKDVAAHLLDTQLRKLSLIRDGCTPPPLEAGPPFDLVALINRLNQEGVAVYGRLSPPVLIELMELASRQSAEFHQSLDPFAEAAFPVSWAGDEVSTNWFDTAREFTERWHHQQQIRLATGRPGIMTPELYHPVLDCFLRALPHAYRNVQAEKGTLLRVDIAGDCGGTWLLLREPDRWRLVAASPNAPACRVSIPQEIAWRVFTKGIDRSAAEAQSTVEGDRRLAEPALSLVAIVA
ncbi:MAG TPA: maleylpyruvate isomerase N-terminal domain-containing protein [Bryobacteraceae bacterium]|nr:maleylpyruvate isomerase N-terminal domain-containing protein [Bryobacteraceae bacterium]